jgi:essential nuclear protein 1
MHKASKADGDKLPVLWHQSLLVFCQRYLGFIFHVEMKGLLTMTHRYASDMTPDQKDALLDVVRTQFHHQIGPEIRRELANSVTRGEPRPQDDDVEMA